MHMGAPTGLETKERLRVRIQLAFTGSQRGLRIEGEGGFQLISVKAGSLLNIQY